MRKGLITVEFGELVNLGKDKFNPTTNANMPCIELEHIDSGTGTINGSVDSREQKSLKSVFHKGDILFSKLRPYLRKYWFADFDGVCSSEIWVLKPKEIVLPHYLFYLIQTEEFIRISNVSSGSKMPRADWDFINHYPLTIIHSLPEQHRIVSVLSLWDTAIAKQTALIEKLTLRKRGLMQQLLTGKKRLKGFGGEWKEVRLGEIARITMGQSPDSKYYNEIGLGLPLIQGNADIQDKKSIQRFWTSNITKTCEGGDIIMSVRAPVGEIAIATQKSCIGRGVCAIKNTSIEKKYLYQLLLFEEDSWKNIEQGGTFTAINSNEIRNKAVIIPATDEQNAIASVLVDADKEIEIQKQKLAAMQEEKKGLMQVLLTGKKRIK